MIERISREDIPEQAGHVYRYDLAKEWIESGDRVIDVACGIGYGAQILSSKKINYVGIDKIEPDTVFRKYGNFISGVDLTTWTYDQEFDVSLCFETLEHLPNPSFLAEQLKAGKKLIIVSVPTRPTKHLNSFHLQDFTVQDILDLFSDCELLHLEDQPEELSHIFVFRGRGAF